MIKIEEFFIKVKIQKKNSIIILIILIIIFLIYLTSNRQIIILTTKLNKNKYYINLYKQNKKIIK